VQINWRAVDSEMDRVKRNLSNQFNKETAASALPKPDEVRGLLKDKYALVGSFVAGVFLGVGSA